MKPFVEPECDSTALNRPLRSIWTTTDSKTEGLQRGLLLAQKDNEKKNLTR